MKNKLFYFGMACLAVILVLGIFYIGNKPSEENLFGRSITSEITIFDGTHNAASVSMTEASDAISYSGDIAATLSVGDVVLFEPVASSSLPDPLKTTYTYYVVSASDSAFEVSETRGGTVVDLQAGSTGGEKFFREINSYAGNVADSRHITGTIDAMEAPSLSLKFVCSIMDDAPDWYASRSADNRWEYCGVYDIEDAALIPGDTGLTIRGSENNRMFTVNTDEIQWFSVRSESFASGSVTIKLKTSD